MDHPFMSLVIPAYNEQARLPAALSKLKAFLAKEPPHYEVLVVDDGSKDSTPAIVNEAMVSFPELRLLREQHRGKGHAVRKGMLAARGQYVMFCDADFSMPVEEVVKFSQALSNGCEVAIGSAR